MLVMPTMRYLVYVIHVKSFIPIGQYLRQGRLRLNGRCLSEAQGGTKILLYEEKKKKLGLRQPMNVAK